MKEIFPNPLSFTTIPISMYLHETQKKLATGTAFMYEYLNKFYLITNWHNVTGLNPITKKALAAHGGIPDVLSFSLLVENQTAWDNFQIELYENNVSNWLIHPIHRENVDVVAIEIEIPENFKGIIHSINKIKYDNFSLKVADDVFVLGYPYSLKGSGIFPIWKRGSVATEPDIDQDKLPKFFIDTASKSGMSGSPVVFRRTGIHTDESGKLNSNTIIGEIQGFIGIYSGRITGETELDAQLGIVWKKEVIEEIIIGNIRDNKNFI
ncbi:hypothetical protein BC749_12213 [Flavobacterium araucananum]|uniref:Serine protease n=1 Tax=Flavobacterium araucananum TaxID=946678 RepID=A0A227P5Y5_9FLAO|nr:hypothetical protein [Flavobacterium araucananum]OXG05309.1 hypothetical protein B0A64_13120 [Flavobacterium araucananum]PWJ89675.1 hypothetical protein BC749_12213 [Flavobacterium araucananum]